MASRSGILEQLWLERREYSRYEAMTDLLELAGADRELLTSARELEQRWHWPRRRVRAFLEFLKKADVATLEVVPGSTGIVGTRIRLTLDPGERTVRATTTYAQPSLPLSDVENRVDRARCNDLRASADRVSPPHPPLGSEISVQTAVHPGGDRGAGKEGGQRTVATAELSTPHDRYAAELAQVLNQAQLANPLIDPDTFSPISANHRATREAALAMLNAGVPLEYAKRAAWTEGARYKPTARHPQILSLAYLRGGVIRDWIRSRATKDVQDRVHDRRCPRTSGFQAIADVLATLPVTTPIPRPRR